MPISGQLWYGTRGSGDDLKIVRIGNDGNGTATVEDDNPPTELNQSVTDLGVDTALGIYFAIINDPVFGDAAYLVRGTTGGGDPTVLVDFRTSGSLVSGFFVDTVNRRIFLGVQEPTASDGTQSGIRQYSYDAAGALTDNGFIVTQATSNKPLETADVGNGPFQAPIFAPNDFDYDPVNNRLYFTESLNGGAQSQGLFSLSLANPTVITQVVSQSQFPDTGTGGYIRDVEVDAARGRVYFSVVSDNDSAAENGIWTVPINSANATATKVNLGALPADFSPDDIAFDAATNQLYVEDGDFSANADTIRVYQLSADGLSGTLAGTITPTFADPNSAVQGMIFTQLPTLAATATATPIAAGGASAPVFNAATVTDAEGYLTGATVQITANRQASDVLSVTTVSGITQSYNSATGLLTLTGVQTAANYSSVVNSLRFSTGTTTGPTSRTITTILNDGSPGVPAGSTNTGTYSFAVQNNAAPVLDLNGPTAGATTVTVLEGASGVVAPDATVSDSDSANFDTGTLTVGYASGGTASDFVSVQDQGGQFAPNNRIGVSGSGGNFQFYYNQVLIGSAPTPTPGSSLVVTFNANATAAAVQALVRAVTTGTTSDAPPAAARSLTFTLTDGDGGTGTDSAAVTITPVNDAPTIGNLSGDTVTFTEGGGQVYLDATPAATIIDPDSANFNGGSLRVQITAGLQSGVDAIFFVGNGRVSLSSQSAGATVNVQLAGDASPVAIGTLANNNLFVNDTLINFNTDGATPARVQELLRSITYNGNDDALQSGQRTITYTLTDGDGGTTGTTSFVNAVGVNDAPVVNAGSATAAAFVEGANTASTPVAVAPSVSLSDPDNTTFASARVTISANREATDLLAFTNTSATTFGNIAASYDAATGVLTLTSSGATATRAQFQAALRAVTFTSSSDTPSTATRTVSFVVNDGTADSAAASRNVTVAATNDAPVAVDDALAASDEDSVRTILTSTLLGNDTDPEGNTLTVTGVTAVTGGAVTLNGTTITFTPTANYNGPASFDYSVSDGQGGTDVGRASFTVTAVNDAPTLTGLTSPVTFDEASVNTAPQLLDTDVTFGDVEGNVAGGSVTVAGLLGEDRVALRNQGTGAGQIGVAGADVSYGGTVIGTASGGSGSTFTVALNANATVAAVDALIQNLTYANASDAPTAARTLSLNVTDAAGGAVSTRVGFTEQTGAANPFNGITTERLPTPTFIDLDGDGDRDAVVGIGSGGFLAFRNNGAGQAFTPLTGAANPFNGIDIGSFSRASSVDIDGDGDLDVVAGSSSTTLRVLRNNGVGQAFTEVTGANNPYQSFSTTYAAPGFVDLDGDGDLDTVVGGRFGDPLTALRNNGVGSAATVFATNPFTTVANPYISVATFVDLDGDGDADLLLGDTNGFIRAYRNNGFNQAFTELTGPANPFNGLDFDFYAAVGLVDLDNDGDLDAVVGSSDPNDTAGALQTFLNAPAGGGGLPLVVNVTAVNDAPTAAIAAGLIATEQVAQSLKGAITIADADAAAGLIDATLSVNYGLLAVTAGGSGATVVSGSGTSSVTVRGTLAQLDALLRTDGTSTVAFTANSDTPPANATLTVLVNDNGNTGTGGALTGTDSEVIAITAVSDAPAGTNGAVAGTEDTRLVLTAADFGFSDVDGDTFNAVILSTVPTSGNLYYDTDGAGGALGQLLIAGDVVDIATINANQLVYVPNANANGTDSFTFQVRDTGTTANGGTNVDPTPNTLIINRAAVDDAPVAVADSATTAENATVTINLLTNDTDIDDGPKSITTINGTAVTTGTMVTLASGATVTNNGDGTVIYNSNGVYNALPGATSGASNLSAADSFDYTLNGGSSATVSVTVTGVDSDDTLQGTAGNDDLNGGAGADTINAGDGDDTLRVTGGTTSANTPQEVANGGAGNDLLIADYSQQTEQVGLYLPSDGAGGATGFVDIPNGTNKLSFTDIERLNITTGTGNDIVNALLGGNTITTAGGDDLVIFNTASAASTVTLGDGTDTFAVRGAAGQVRLTFRSAGIGNGDATDPVAAGGDGLNNVRLQTEDGSDGLTGAVTRVDDEGTTFVADNGITFDVRDVSGTQRGDQFRVVALGTSGADTLAAATSLAYYFNGGMGDDTITGAAGNDFLVGGGGADTLDGGDGNDSFIGGAGNDTINGGLGDDTVLFDLVTGGADTITLGDGADVVQTQVFAGQVRLTFRSAGVGNGDPLDTDGLNNVRLQTEDGSDGLTGGVSRIDDEGTTFVAAAGQTYDVRDISGTQRGDQFEIVVLGTAGADTFTALQPARPYYFNGGMGDDTITGGTANDFLVGGGGADTLDGGDGNDSFIGGAGNDTITGGAGDDTVLFDVSTGGADTITLGTGADVVQTQVFAGQIRLTFRSAGVGNGDALDTDGLNNVRLQTEDGSDGLTGPISRIDDEGTIFVAATGQTFDVRDIGGTQRGDQFGVVVLGTSADDTLTAADPARAYYFNGGQGNDAITGGTANDVLVGGAGADTLDGGDGNDTLLSGSTIDRGVGVDRMNGGAGDDRLVYQGDTNLNGEVIANGGDGGDDLLIADLSHFDGPISTTLAADPAGGSSGQFTDNVNQNIAFTGIERFQITGSGLRDNLVTGNGADVINGGGGADRLQGNGGNDRLDGGADDDIAAYAGARSGYTVVRNGDGSYTVTDIDLSNGDDGTDTLVGIERLEFDRLELGIDQPDLFVTGSQQLAAPGALRPGYISFSVTTAGTITITAGDRGAVAGNGTDSVIYLFTAAGVLIASDDDGGAGVDSRLFVNLAVGDYVLAISEYDFGEAEARAESNSDDDAAFAPIPFSVSFTQGTAVITQPVLDIGETRTGTADADALYGFTGDDTLLGLDGDDTLFAGSGNDTVDGGNGNDLLRLEVGGNEVAIGGAGNDAFIFGDTLTAADQVDGGTGKDVLAIQGNYSAGLVLGASNLVGIETLSFLAGNDTRFGTIPANGGGGGGGAAGPLALTAGTYSYNITSVDASVAAGESLIINAAALLVGENLAFNGSAETDGSFFFYGGLGTDTLTGGANADVFYMGENRYAAGDRFVGGAGADIVVLRGNYAVTLEANTFTSIETLTLTSASDTRFVAGGAEYDYSITSVDANVAAGATLTINGGRLTSEESLAFNGSAETNGNFRIFGGAGNDVLTGGTGNDLIFGGARGDTLTGGAGNDTFRYQALADSNSTERDGIQDFTLGDLIDLSRIDANVNLAGEQAFTFIGTSRFSQQAGQLRFENISSGGPIFLVQGDVDGDGVSDFEVIVVVADSNPITVGDFVL